MSGVVILARPTTEDDLFKDESYDWLDSEKRYWDGLSGGSTARTFIAVFLLIALLDLISMAAR